MMENGKNFQRVQTYLESVNPDYICKERAGFYDRFGKDAIITIDKCLPLPIAIYMILDTSPKQFSYGARTITDIFYILLKNNYSQYSLKEVYEALEYLYLSNYSALFSYICNDIHKRVYGVQRYGFLNLIRNRQFFNSVFTDEYLYDFPILSSNYLNESQKVIFNKDNYGVDLTIENLILSEITL